MQYNSPVWMQFMHYCVCYRTSDCSVIAGIGAVSQIYFF